jgi:hypothetical protein
MLAGAAVAGFVAFLYALIQVMQFFGHKATT